MARKHADRVDAAIKALALDSKRNLNATQIWRLLSAGEAGLEKPIEMPKRTVQHKVASIRREFSYSVDPLQDQDEVEVADSILRDYLRTGLADAKRFHDLQKTGKLSQSDRAAMLADSKIISEIRRHFAKQRTPTRSETNAATKAAQKGRQLTPASTLERMADKLREPASLNGPMHPGDDVSQLRRGERSEGLDADRSDEAAPHSVSRSSQQREPSHA